jgi:two-component system chemotaxis response regulator CheB
MIKVMLVDDSGLTLVVLKRMLAQAPDIVVVGTACNGQEALALLPELQPDVICTDLKMPVMDGLAFTKAVMTEFPRPILVVSAAVQSSDTSNIFNLMQAGAIDVIAKPGYVLTDESGMNARDLINKIRVLSGVHVIARKRAEQSSPAPAVPVNVQTSTPPQIIGIGASTGGPQALHQILTALPANFPLPIVCVQHISEGFSVGLVNWLNHECELTVQFAETGLIPEPGHVYFAPDNKQLETNAQKQLVCTSAPSYGGHRPAISVTLQSLALHFGRYATGVLLTGMGRDGVDGLQSIKQVGGMTIAQDEASSIVFGMPRVAIEEQAAQVVLPLAKIAQALVKLAMPLSF